jgi:hypothetical protein
MSDDDELNIHSASAESSNQAFGVEHGVCSRTLRAHTQARAKTPTMLSLTFSQLLIKAHSSITRSLQELSVLEAPRLWIVNYIIDTL